MKRNGYMMVRYSAPIPNDYHNEELKANGERIHINSNYSLLYEKLKVYYNHALSDNNISIEKKDLRSGWFIVNAYNREKILLAIMHYSNKRIKPILI